MFTLQWITHLSLRSAESSLSAFLVLLLFALESKCSPKSSNDGGLTLSHHLWIPGHYRGCYVGKLWNSRVVEPKRRNWVITGNGTRDSLASVLEIHIPRSPFIPFLCIVSQSVSGGLMEVMLLLLKDCVTVRKNESSSGRHKEKILFVLKSMIASLQWPHWTHCEVLQTCSVKAPASLSLALHCREGISLLASWNLDSEFGSSHNVFWSLGKSHVDLI